MFQIPPESSIGVPEMATMSVEPADGLCAGGRRLWADVVARHDLHGGELAILVEACRAKDRCDRLDQVVRCGGPWRSASKGVPQLGVVDAAREARRQANLMKQLLAALRLPDEQGRRPARRPPRGVYRPRQPGRNPR